MKLEGEYNMKNSVKHITTITILLTIIFQMLAIIIDELNTTVLAVEKQVEETKEISREYEIKEEATFDLSEKGDNSVIGKYTHKDKTLKISGIGRVEDKIPESYKIFIENIIIEEGVTSIRGSAFEGCSSLSSITIPEGVTSIGYRAFSGCSSLSNISIPEGVTSIEFSAFKGCSSLSSITIPEGVTIIEYSAFEG